jgi:hypothetical protein
VGAEGDGGTVGERQRDRAVAQWGSRARRRDRAGRQPVVGGWSFVLPPSPFVLRPSSFALGRPAAGSVSASWSLVIPNGVRDQVVLATVHGDAAQIPRRLGMTIRGAWGDKAGRRWSVDSPPPSVGAQHAAPWVACPPTPRLSPQRRSLAPTMACHPQRSEGSGGPRYGPWACGTDPSQARDDNSGRLG